MCLRVCICICTCIHVCVCVCVYVFVCMYVPPPPCGSGASWLDPRPSDQGRCQPPSPYYENIWCLLKYFETITGLKIYNAQLFWIYNLFEIWPLTCIFDLIEQVMYSQWPRLVSTFQPFGQIRPLYIKEICFVHVLWNLK